ncbi:MAG: hypothetical protein SOT28_10510, partial [Fusicatenibacter sp.]|nr:hypothetical protein [Lachnospiraceae bacterium]MDY2938721.1 hypothetical protein [Fusicatenibacter sp.]
ATWAWNSNTNGVSRKALIGGIKMLPGTYRATQKFYIFLIVYLTGRTPFSGGSFFEKQKKPVLNPADPRLF